MNPAAKVPRPNGSQSIWPEVELREIRVFLTLVEELHYGRTAERLLLTPSRVSQIIRQLEARVGGHLFDRTSRRVRLTPLGERLRSNLAPICAQLERALDDVHQATTDVVGTLRIGMYAPPSLGSYIVDIVRTFETGHPEADVSRAAIMSTSRARRISR